MIRLEFRALKARQNVQW